MFDVNYYCRTHCLNKMLPKHLGGDRLAGSISRMAERELLATLRDRYQAFSKEDKSRILDDFTAVAGHHHKHGIRLPAQSEDGRGKVRAAEVRRMLQRGDPCLRSFRPPGLAPCRGRNFHPTPSCPPVGWSSG